MFTKEVRGKCGYRTGVSTRDNLSSDAFFEDIAPASPLRMPYNLCVPLRDSIVQS